MKNLISRPAFDVLANGGLICEYDCNKNGTDDDAAQIFVIQTRDERTYAPHYQSYKLYDSHEKYEV